MIKRPFLGLLFVIIDKIITFYECFVVKLCLLEYNDYINKGYKGFLLHLIIVLQNRGANMDDIRLKEKLAIYEKLLKTADIVVYEYHPVTDTAIKYDEKLKMVSSINGYMSKLESDGRINESEKNRYVQFIRGMDDGSLEIECVENGNEHKLKRIRKIHMIDQTTGEDYIILTKKDITFQRVIENKYREQAQRDPMTRLYNRVRGKELIENYLASKTPYEACAMLVMDVDYFKGVNDSYGHLFGDKVLVVISDLLMRCFSENAVVARIGGDEFLVFVMNTNNKTIISSVDWFMKEVRKLHFTENDYTPTCSVGVCFVTENMPHSSYDRIFGNADWALYQAKKQGRNRYAFCDNMHRFEECIHGGNVSDRIDARYFQNDILATAFEVFERNTSFEKAMNLMLEIMGIRFQLDRVTAIRSEIARGVATSLYQWRIDGTRKNLGIEMPFKKDDFIEFYKWADEYNTVVINYDKMDSFSDSAKNILLQENAKTVLYVAIYGEEEYRGTIAFVTTEQKRFWSKDKRRELSEVAKIMAIYRKRRTEAGQNKCNCLESGDYDNLTGLISFTRFMELAGRALSDNLTDTYVVVYSDIENFTVYNRIYGYEKGDRLLKDFTNYIISTISKKTETYFTRIVSDQFVLFMPFDVVTPDMDYKVRRLNDTFIRQIIGDDNQANIRIRTGICPVMPGFKNIVAAVDFANMARRQIDKEDEMNVKVYEISSADYAIIDE